VPDNNAAVVRSLFEAFNDGDLVRAAANVSDDFELVDVAAGQTFRGPDGCRQWLEMFRTALPDARTELVNVFAEGDRVASEHIGRGTHTGPFVTPAGRIPPTGRRVELRIGEFYGSATARSPTSTPTTTARP
jgi:predicted ester cyclase